MAKIIKKFIGVQAVDETKILLSNNAFLQARNAANSVDVDLFKLNASNVIEFASLPQAAGSPTNAADLVNKSYIDNLIAGIKWKAPARVASTANLNLAAPGAIDGVSLATSDRVLVKDQTVPSENGLYVFNGTALVRSSDADAGTEIASMAVFVEEGTVNADKGFVCTTDNPITIGSTSIAFVQFSASNAYSAGQGIDISSNVISVALAAVNPGLEFNSNQLRVLVDPAGAIVRGAAGIAVQLEASNPTLRINGSNELGVKFATGSALRATATGLEVEVETASMEIVSNKLQPKLNAAGALDKTSGLEVKVDGSTIKINGSNQLESVKAKQDIITLSAGDIANQYVDLSATAYSASSVLVSPVGGPIQELGVDYTVSLTGGVSGFTRISFAGDLASVLVAADKLIVRFEYL